MAHVSLSNVIPVILVVGTIGLFVHKWSGGEPQQDAITTAVNEPARPASGEGSGAHPPPATSMDPTPAGTPAPPDNGNTPASATPTAPSGEPARPEGSR